MSLPNKKNCERVSRKHTLKWVRRQTGFPRQIRRRQNRNESGEKILDYTKPKIVSIVSIGFVLSIGPVL